MNIVVLAEDMPDATVACGLADRILEKESPEWIGAQLDAFRRWRGIEEGTVFTKWARLNSIARDKGIRVLGHRRDEKGGYDYGVARKAIVLANRYVTDLKAIVMMRDMDRQADDRRRSLEEARAHFGNDTVPVVIAAPLPMREAWILNGFEPNNAVETARHLEAKRSVGCDPCEQAHRLLGRQEDDPRSPKRIVKLLTGGDADREVACWVTTDLIVLMRRGRDTNLADYLSEVQKILVPLLQR